jgi:MYXO-CTERM domain-containing protein
MRFWSASALLLAVIAAGRARADGAFPDELQVFLPPATDSIVVATNFGMLRSLSGGPFVFVCEAAIGAGSNVGLYQARADGTVLAEAGLGLFHSADWGCGWSAAMGSVQGVYVYDAAMDPGSSPRALAIGVGTQSGETTIFPSDDEGATFGAATYTVAGALSGIELSAVTSGTAFAVGNAPPADAGVGAPFVLVSRDYGQTFPTRSDHPELTGQIARLAAVDPTAADTLYLRVSYTAYDEIWVSRDAGKTLQKLFTSSEPVSAFLAGPDGTLYAGTRNSGLYRAPATNPSGFALVNASVHPRCLGERDGTVYVCGDDFKDGFALGSSTDQGDTFIDVVRFDQISGLASCAEPDFAQTCAFAWQSVQRLFGIGDAGGTSADAGATPMSNSCGGCAVATDAGLPMLAVALAFLRSRRRHPPTR